MIATRQFRSSLQVAGALALAVPAVAGAQSVIAGPSASGSSIPTTSSAAGTSASTSGTGTSAGTGTATGGGAVPGTAGGTGTATPAATGQGVPTNRPVPVPITTPGSPGSAGTGAVFGPETSTLRTNQPTGAYIAADNARLQGSQTAQNIATQGGFGAPLNNAAATASREVATFDTGQSAASVGNIRDNVSFGPVTPGANATVISAQTAVANPQNAVGNTGAINDQNLRANESSLGNQLNFTNQSVLNQNGLQTGLGTASNPVLTPSGAVQTTTPGRQGILLGTTTTASSEQAARQNATTFIVTPIATPTQAAASTGTTGATGSTGMTGANTTSGGTTTGASSGNTASAGGASQSGAGTGGTIAGTSAAVSRSVNVVGYAPGGGMDRATLQSQGITIRESGTSAEPQSAPSNTNTR